MNHAGPATRLQRRLGLQVPGQAWRAQDPLPEALRAAFTQRYTTYVAEARAAFYQSVPALVDRLFRQGDQIDKNDFEKLLDVVEQLIQLVGQPTPDERRRWDLDDESPLLPDAPEHSSPPTGPPAPESSTPQESNDDDESSPLVFTTEDDEVAESPTVAAQSNDSGPRDAPTPNATRSNDSGPPDPARRRLLNDITKLEKRPRTPSAANAKRPPPKSPDLLEQIRQRQPRRSTTAEQPAPKDRPYAEATNAPPERSLRETPMPDQSTPLGRAYTSFAAKFSKDSSPDDESSDSFNNDEGDSFDRMRTPPPKPKASGAQQPPATS